MLGKTGEILIQIMLGFSYCVGNGNMHMKGTSLSYFDFVIPSTYTTDIFEVYNFLYKTTPY
jgi:hypothetical protein